MYLANSIVSYIRTIVLQLYFYGFYVFKQQNNKLEEQTTPSHRDASSHLSFLCSFSAIPVKGKLIESIKYWQTHILFMPSISYLFPEMLYRIASTILQTHISNLQFRLVYSLISVVLVSFATPSLCPSICHWGIWSLLISQDIYAFLTVYINSCIGVHHPFIHTYILTKTIVDYKGKQKNKKAITCHRTAIDNDIW